MADNNRNRGNRPYSSREDWNQGENRFHQGNDYDRGRENYESYGNASFGNDDRRDFGSRNVNYIPDNDDNRGFYEGRQGNYGDAYSSDYGYQNSRHQQPYKGVSNRKQWGSQWGSHYGASHNPQYSSYDHDYDMRYLQDRNDNSDRHPGMGGFGNNRQNMNRPYSDYQQAYQQGPQSYNRRDNSDDQNWWDRTRNEVSSWFSDDDNDNKGRNSMRTAETYRGKGPKNYQRSTERIYEDVCDRLADDDMLDASDIEVKVEGSEVILTGTVLSRDAKRRAEDIVESVSGVRNVENRIRVGRADEIEGNYTTRQIIRAVDENQSDSNK